MLAYLTSPHLLVQVECSVRVGLEAVMDWQRMEAFGELGIDLSRLERKLGARSSFATVMAAS